MQSRITFNTQLKIAPPLELIFLFCFVFFGRVSQFHSSKKSI